MRPRPGWSMTIKSRLEWREGSTCIHRCCLDEASGCRRYARNRTDPPPPATCRSFAPFRTGGRARSSLDARRRDAVRETGKGKSKRGVAGCLADNDRPVETPDLETIAGHRRARPARAPRFAGLRLFSVRDMWGQRHLERLARIMASDALMAAFSRRRTDAIPACACA